MAAGDAFVPTLPQSGQQVRLRTVEGLEAFCPVLARDERRVLLGVEAPASDDAEIVYSHPHGVICLVGSIPPGAECVAFRIRGQRTLDQRRNAYRVALERPAQVRRPGGVMSAVTTEDISVRGVRVLSDDPAAAGEAVTVTFPLADEPISLDGRVIRPDARGYSIEFEPLPRAVDDLLSRFVTDAQRRRLRGQL